MNFVCNRFEVKLFQAVLLLGCASAVHAQIQVSVNTQQLLPDTPDQIVLLSVSGGTPVASFDLFAGFDDGSDDAPVITDVNLVLGTIFESNNSGTASGGSTRPGTVAVNVIASDLGNLPVAEGLVAELTVSTVGIFDGDFDLDLATLEGSTFFTNQTVQPIGVQLPSNTFVIVPEPAMLSAVMMIGGLVLRRRRA